MLIHIFHNGLATADSRGLEGEFDAGRFSFSLRTHSQWGHDNYLIRAGHHEHSPDVIVAHSSLFQFDLLRMLKFILFARTQAPWVVYVLLLSSDEEREVALLARPIRDHFSQYFQVARSQFSLPVILAYLAGNIQRIEDLVMIKRQECFGTDVILRSDLDRQVGWDNESDYDFAISFSGAQRAQARDLANALKGRGCNVFFDEFETTSIVGKNLAEELYQIYSTRSRYCIILVSKEYRDGPWTNQERRAALDKAIHDTQGTYIIPIRIDAVDLPGMSSSISYLKWQSGAIEIANILYEKLVSVMVDDPVRSKGNR